MSSASYKRELADLAKSLGFSVELTQNNHYKMLHPKTKQIVFASGTPGDHRVLRNIEGKLRRSLREVGIAA